MLDWLPILPDVGWELPQVNHVESAQKVIPPAPPPTPLVATAVLSLSPFYTAVLSI